MGDDLPHLLRQILQQFIFGWRQVEFDRIHRGLPALEVQARTPSGRAVRYGSGNETRESSATC